MTRRRRWTAGLLGAIALIVTLAAVLFEWTWFRPLVESFASNKLGRTVEIRGDIDLEIGLKPRIVLEETSIANARWASAPDMLRVERLAFVIDLWRLWQGTVVLPEIALEQPRVLVERADDGRLNWIVGPQQAAAESPTPPRIGGVTVQSGTLRYRAPGRRIEATIAELQGDGGHRTGQANLRATGAIGDLPFTLDVAAGALAELEVPGQAYAFDATLTVQKTTTSLAGTITHPLAIATADLTLDLQGPRPEPLLAVLAPAFEQPLASIANAPIRLHAELVGDGGRWRLDDLVARAGGSDIRGALSVDLAAERPSLEATLESDQADVRDLRALLRLFGLWPEPAAIRGEDRSQPIATLEGLNRKLLSNVQADVSYTAGVLEGRRFHLRDVDLRGRLDNGVPAIALAAKGSVMDQPARFDLRAGSPDEAPGDGRYPLEGEIEAGGTRIDIAGATAEPAGLRGLKADFRITSTDLDRWLRRAGLDAPRLPRFSATGRIARDGQAVALRDLYVESRGSHLAGTLSIDLGGSRPLITADLESERLLVAQLVPASADDDVEGPQLLSARGINLDLLPEVDVDALLVADYVRAKPLRLDRLELRVRLRDRVAVVDLSGEGEYRSRPLTLKADLGTEQNLEHPSARYPVDVRLSSGKTLARAEGAIGEPLALDELDIDVVFEGQNLDRLGDILQLSLPATPPYRLHGELSRRRDRWRLEGLDGRIADSDVTGTVVVDVVGERPTIEAELRSAHLDFDDLGTLVGVPPEVEEDESASERQQRLAARQAADEDVLPQRRFDIAELRKVDAKLTYRAEEVLARGVPLTGVTMNLRLEDGILRITPLLFRLEDGRLEASLNLDATADPIGTELEASVRQVKLTDLLDILAVEVPGFGEQTAARGRLSGHASLSARGNSVAKAAAAADGKVALLMEDGAINALLIEAAGLDVGEVLRLMASSHGTETMAPINCLIARAAASDGVIDTRALVLDTADSRITGQGTIELGKETVALRFLAHPKDPSVLSASVPVLIEGSFGDLSIHPGDELTDKAYRALALGVLLPVVGAAIPFIETGDAISGRPCAALLEAAERARAAGSRVRNGTEP